MKFSRFILLTLLITITSSVIAAPGPYLQAAAGLVSVTPDSSHGFTSDFFSSDSGVGGRLATGYLWSTQQWDYGLETGILAYPHNASILLSDFFKTTYKGYNVDALAVLKYHFLDFAVFAKGGAAYVKQHLLVQYRLNTNKPYTQLGSFSGDKIAPEAALGIDYDLTPNLSTNLTANVVFAGKAHPINSANPINYNPTTTNSSLLLGITYRFDDSSTAT